MSDQKEKLIQKTATLQESLLAKCKKAEEVVGVGFSDQLRRALPPYLEELNKKFSLWQNDASTGVEK